MGIEWTDCPAGSSRGCLELALTYMLEDGGPLGPSRKCCCMIQYHLLFSINRKCVYEMMLTLQSLFHNDSRNQPLLLCITSEWKEKAVYIGIEAIIHLMEEPASRKLGDFIITMNYSVLMWINPAIRSVHKGDLWDYHYACGCSFNKSILHRWQ